MVGNKITDFWPIGVGCHGPMNQNKFLHKMGIRRRLEVCQHMRLLVMPMSHAHNSPRAGAATEGHSGPSKRPVEWLRDVDPPGKDGYPLQVSGTVSFTRPHPDSILIDNTTCTVSP